MVVLDSRSFCNFARTDWCSGESRQTFGQSTVVSDPGAAPITSNIHSAGLAPGGHCVPPLVSKYRMRVAEFCPISAKNNDFYR